MKISFLCRITAGMLVAILATAALVAAPASAQVHQKTMGPYIMRANIVDADMLPREVKRRHGIRDAGAVLNVVVLEKDPAVPDTAHEAGAVPGPVLETVPAKVTATIESPAGYRRDIALREVVAQGRVSYIGTFPAAAPRSIYEFTVRVRLPDGTESTLRFEEWLPDEFK